MYCIAITTTHMQHCTVFWPGSQCIMVLHSQRSYLLVSACNTRIKEMSKYCTVTEQQKQYYTCCQNAATIVSNSGLNSPSRTAVKRTLYSRRMSNALIFQWLIPRQAWLSSGGPSVESPELTRLSTSSTCSTCLQLANGLGY